MRGIFVVHCACGTTRNLWVQGYRCLMRLWTKWCGWLRNQRGLHDLLFTSIRVSTERVTPWVDWRSSFWLAIKWPTNQGEFRLVSSVCLSLNSLLLLDLMGGHLNLLTDLVKVWYAWGSLYLTCRRDTTQASDFLLEFIIDIGVKLRIQGFSFRVHKLLRWFIGIKWSFACVTHRITLLMLLYEHLLLITNDLNCRF